MSAIESAPYEPSTPSTPSMRARSIPRSLAVAACLAIIAGSTLLTGSPGGAIGNATELAVADWLDDLAAPIAVDQSANCMFGPTQMVAYRTDRIVVRGANGLTNAVIGTRVNDALNAMYGTAQVWVASIERIKFVPLVPLPDVVSVTLVARPGGVDHEVLRLARKLRQDHGMTAAPDYALSTSNHYTYYEPYGNPVPLVGPLPTPRAVTTPVGTAIGTGVKLDVFDTGLESSVDLPKTSMYSSIDNELVNRVQNDGDPLLADYKHAGHGRAIAGTITTVAPGATIEMVRVNDRTGLLTDVEATRRIVEVLKAMTPAQRPQIIVLAFVTAACDVDPTTGLAHMTPIGTGAVVDMVDALDPGSPRGMVVVASAGNMSTTEEHYPAAFPSAISVGALDGNIGSPGEFSPWSNQSRTAPIADFSNTGTWVDVYAVGVGLGTTHVHDVRFESDEPVIQGKAVVSGTSFSAPVFAAHVAEQMSTTGQRARAAVTTLRNNGTTPLHECGGEGTPTGVAVVVADVSVGIASPATGNPVTC